MMNDMTCRRFSDLLEEYLDGTLEGDLSEAVREHAGRCPDCRALLGMKEDLSGEVRVPPAIIAETAAAVRARIRTRRPLGRRLLVPALAFACTVLLFAAGFLAGEVRSLREEARSLRETVALQAVFPVSGDRALARDGEGRRRSEVTVAELVALLERLPDGARVLSPVEAGRLARDRSILRLSAETPAGRMLDDGLTAGEALAILRSLGLDPDASIELGRFMDRAVPPALLRQQSAAEPTS